MPWSPVNVVFGGIVAQTLVKEKRYRNHVGKEEYCNINGHDRIESCSGADIDKCKQQRDHCADQDGVQWESRRRVNLRQTSVSKYSTMLILRLLTRLMYLLNGTPLSLANDQRSLEAVAIIPIAAAIIKERIKAVMAVAPPALLVA